VVLPVPPFPLATAIRTHPFVCFLLKSSPLPCHAGPALGTLFLVAWRSLFVGSRVSTTQANAVSIGARSGSTPASATALSSPHPLATSGTLTRWAGSISSRHSRHLSFLFAYLYVTSLNWFVWIVLAQASASCACRLLSGNRVRVPGSRNIGLDRDSCSRVSDLRGNSLPPFRSWDLVPWVRFCHLLAFVSPPFIFR